MEVEVLVHMGRWALLVWLLGFVFLAAIPVFANNGLRRCFLRPEGFLAKKGGPHVTRVILISICLLVVLSQGLSLVQANWQSGERLIWSDVPIVLLWAMGAANCFYLVAKLKQCRL